MDVPTSSAMDVDGGGATSTQPSVVSHNKEGPSTSSNALTITEDSASTSQWDRMQPVQEMYCQVPVRVHVRRPGKDTWIYVGRATVSHEVMGHSSRVVVRTTNDKPLVTFGEHSELQAERRGNFVIVACVEPTGDVLSWSLCTINMSDTLRLLASIELACYRARQLFADPARFSNTRRRIERVIRDDRRKRHKRKRDEETMISAFAQQKLG